jgi:hypothetical protein
VHSMHRSRSKRKYSQWLFAVVVLLVLCCESNEVPRGRTPVTARAEAIPIPLCLTTLTLLEQSSCVALPAQLRKNYLNRVVWQDLASGVLASSPYTELAFRRSKADGFVLLALLDVMITANTLLAPRPAAQSWLAGYGSGRTRRSSR